MDDKIELLPCRACGAECSVQGFSGAHIMGEALVWLCSNNTKFDGDCPDSTAFLSAEAWNARAAYEVMTRSDGEVRMREALADIEAAALRYNGPLARDRDADTLRAIGKLAALTQSSVQPE